MMNLVLIISVLVSFSIFVSVFELIRRNRLKERYSLLWLFSSLVLLLFSFSPGLLHAVAGLVGIAYPPSLLFLLGLMFLIIINIHFSTIISSLSDRNKDLAQELAMLRDEIAGMRKE